MRSIQLFLLIVLSFTLSLTSSTSYNRPFCGGGWPSLADWESLRSSLSSSTLYGPFYDNPNVDYSINCLLPEQHNVNLLQQGKGLCMSQHSCAHEFCQDLGTMQLPAYSMEIKSTADIQTALQFATTHNVRVAIKSSGHSYESQSMGKDSLLLWMRHFPIPSVEDAITSQYTDSCGTNHGATIAVAGGQNFDDVFRIVKDEYHVVSGSCQTVAMGGGWTLGGGLSFTSRQYGFGVDQVVGVTMVLADGRIVQADACENEDLFWASLGGGGGSFGVVTNVQYKLHPPTKITTLLYKYSGLGNKNAFIRSFVTFMVQELPDLDTRWGGSIGTGQSNLIFVGSAAEAASTSFLIAMDAWYDTLGYDTGFGRPSDLLVEYASWHQYNGGDEAYENPDFDGVASPAPAFTRDTFSRAFPRQVFIDKPNELIDLLTDLYIKGDIDTSACYLLGGATSTVSPTQTSIHPAMREATFTIESINPSAARRVREFLDGYATSVCYNHHSPEEPNWREESWGTNYPRLEAIKKEYDPDQRFNVYHGVGYKGKEFGAPFWETLFVDGCPWRDGINIFSIPVRLLTWLRDMIFY